MTCWARPARRANVAGVMAKRIVRCVVLVSLFAPATARAAEGVPTPEPSPILGGQLVAPCGFPTAVSVGGFCTGTLVHPRVVVYAAHCGDEVPWIRLGDHIEDEFGIEVVPEMCATNPIGEFGFGTDAAFCRLSEPIAGVPIAPPLMGCEADAALQIGQAVTVVGFGQSDDPETTYGIKRRLDTQINDLSWDEVFIGGMDEGVCYGDSGGPTYVRLDGGEWRSFGITSWGQPGCGFGGYLSTIVHNIEWIETTAEVDITPCHDGLGNWDRGPDCTGFEIDPEPVGGDWDDGCDFGPVGTYESTCGDAFDPRIDDLAAPVLSFAQPEAYARFDLPDGAEQMIVPIEVAVDDGEGWGVGTVDLVILADDGEELARFPDPTAPFLYEHLGFPNGIWTLRAEATDRAGNVGASEELVFGIGEDPPMPPPDPDTTSSGGGGQDSTSDDGGDTSGAPSETSTGTPSDDTSSESTGDDAGAVDEGGCGCTSGSSGTAPLALAVVFFARRRRRVALALALASCGDSSGSEPEETSSSGDVDESDTSTGEPEPADSSSGAPADSSSDAPEPEPDMGVPEPEPGCGNAIVEDDELCDDGNLVGGDGCSAACVPSGTLISSTFWPDRPPAYGHDLAPRTDGTYVALASHPGVDTGNTAVVLGLAEDASVAWSTPITGELENENVWPAALAVDASGGVFVVGILERDLVAPEEDVIEPWIARFEPDGTLAWSLSDPSLPGQSYGDVVVTDDGDAIALGTVELADSDWRAVLRRHGATDGATTWEVVGAMEDPESAALTGTFTDDGELLVAGWQQSASGRDIWLGRFADDGTPIDDTTYGEPITYYYPHDVAMDASGDVMLCGSVVRASAQNAVVGRFTLGAADPKVWMERLEPPGPGLSSCEALALDDDGRVAIGGIAFDADEGYEHLFARFSGDGLLLWTARLSAVMGYSYDSVEGVALDPNGDIVAVGSSQDERGLDRMWIGIITG